MQHQSRIQTQRRIHTNENHRQSSGNLRTGDEKRVQEKVDALRRALLALLASFVAGPNAAWASHPSIVISAWLLTE